LRIAIPQFPGSNCDQDAYHSLRDDLALDAEYVWHEERSLDGFDGVFIPGGFTYGDYLRVGAMASRAPIMDGVREMAEAGKPVLGVCNGFQILCEAGLLPGALMPNREQKFICRYVHLKSVNRDSIWTRGVDRILHVPVAHGAGRYVCDDATLEELETGERIAFRYVSSSGEATPEANRNGSVAAIAGILNKTGNVLGMMPHPERATRAILGSTDGIPILRGFSLVRANL
jgi:phosphoribosylformylglycinamidine synthase subunit PurQ / glutaminase